MGRIALFPHGQGPSGAHGRECAHHVQHRQGASVDAWHAYEWTFTPHDQGRDGLPVDAVAYAATYEAAERTVELALVLHLRRHLADQRDPS